MPQSHQGVSLRDIARVMGVSAMTVSRALRNQPRISETLRGQIEKKARELGYEPDPMLAALAHYRNQKMEKPVRAAVAWLNFWQPSDALRKFPMLDAYWRGAARSAQKFGYYLEEFVLSDTMPLRRIEKILLARNVRGLLLPPLQQGRLPAGWQRFGWENFSLVRLGESFTALNANVVKPHLTANEIFAFNKMREKGYQRIGLVTQHSDRLKSGAGFLWAQLGQPEKLRVPPLIFPGHDYQEYQQALVRWLKKEKPDAIYTNNEHLAGMLEKAGYRVPSDIGLVASTVPDCKISAGINANAEEIGRVAFLLLNSLMRDNDRGVSAIPREVLIKGEWIDGASLPDL